MADSGEGRWTVAEAIDLDVPAPVITLSLHDALRQPRRTRVYAAKLLAAMRNQFGGHAIKPDDHERAELPHDGASDSGMDAERTARPSPSSVIFGASGDLTQRKLIPAFFSLCRKDRLPAQLRHRRRRPHAV